MNLDLGGKFAIFGGIKRRFELYSRNIHHLDVLLGNICRCDVYSNVSLKSRKSENMDIIAAQNTHIDELVRLNALVQEIHSERYPGIFKYPIDFQSVKEEFQSNISNEDHFIYIALANNDVVGYIWAQHMKRPESALAYAARKMYIHHISVSKSQRRCSIGKLLIERIEKEANSLNVDYIALDVWCFNQGAESFFKGAGYEPFNINMWKRRVS